MFNVSFWLEGVEFRSLITRNGVDRSGNPRVYRSVRVEDVNGEPLQIDVRNDAVWSDCMRLEKGDIVNLACRAVATQSYSFLVLEQSPEVAPVQEG